MARFVSIVGAVSLLMSASFNGVGTAWAAPTAAGESDQETVTLEWFGHMFFRFTTANGVVLLTTPNFDNGAPMSPADVQRADIILIPNGHGDDRGSVVEVGPSTRATVLAPTPLGDWLVEQGIERSLVVGTQPGNTHDLHGIRIRTVQNIHDQRIGGPGIFGGAVGYIITFENGFTVYFAASSDITMDMQLYGSIYKPHVALLNAQPGRDPAVVAQMARLIATDNPNLHTVIPIHIRAGDPVVPRLAAAVQQLGLPVTVFEPAIGLPYEY